MHVTFVSSCEKRAIIKTRRILDRYAFRIGEKTWITPMTSEALQSVYQQLRSSASRYTSIRCFRNYGSRVQKLIWIVGTTKKTSPSGQSVIKSVSKVKKNTFVQQWHKDIILTAEESGYWHDLGKMSADFANKINPKNASNRTADPVRHELISTCMLKLMLSEGKTWDQAWSNLTFNHSLKIAGVASGTRGKAGLIFGDGIFNLTDALKFCVLTHHRLFKSAHADNHMSFDSNNYPVSRDQRNSDDIQRLIEHSIGRIRSIELREDNKYWTFIAIVSRAVLILADHTISSIVDKPYGNKKNSSEIFFANTTRDKDGRNIYNQKLSYHLAAVGNKGKQIAAALFDQEYDGLSINSIDAILQPAPPLYNWQNIAVNNLEASKQTLTLNVASTGSGKTRMNAKIIASLSKSKKCRFTTLLGLRSLTLQTGDAYKDELGIHPNELSVVIGCSTTRKLHEYEDNDRSDNIRPISNTPYEELTAEIDFEVILDRIDSDIPSWIKELPYDKASNLILTPVLVSTVDYLISAGDLAKQGNHSLCMFRLMNSDLILDEIDGYDPKSLSAVIRLIKISAMFGRNVVVSSGTLPEIIANYVWQSFQSGVRIREAYLAKSILSSCYLINDVIEPREISAVDVNDFIKLYQSYLSDIQNINAKSSNVTKRALIVAKNDLFNEQNLVDSIKNSILELHKCHKWSDYDISIGLIRVANIKKAVELAETLSKEPNTVICCYHSRHFLIQRYYIEKCLDKVLKRKDKDWQKNILDDNEISRYIQSCKKDVKFVVVATPVEEVGRDHDFDWAIIEPSSVHSIVQTAGRVNRHRRTKILDPNIHLLNYNFKYATNKKQAVFVKPGLEEISPNGSSHGEFEKRLLSELIDESFINQRLDSSLCFDLETHKFSKFDSDSMSRVLDKFAKPFIDFELRWMDADYYQQAVLRERNITLQYFYGEDRNWYQLEQVIQNKKPVQKSRISNDWFNPVSNLKGLFTLSYEELVSLATQTGISLEKAFSVTVYPKTESDMLCYVMSKFGCSG